MNSKIKFSHSNDQTIDLGNFKDCLSSLLAIGAVMATSKPGTEGKTEYATDLEGLKTLLKHSEFTRDSVMDMVKSLSFLLITVNGYGHDIETEHALRLIHGLAGLAEKLTAYSDELNHSISRAQSQAIKNPD